MADIPDEKATWADPTDPEVTARELREQLKAAKARMAEHRETMRAAGLTHLGEKDKDAPAAPPSTS